MTHVCVADFNFVVNISTIFVEIFVVYNYQISVQFGYEKDSSWGEKLHNKAGVDGQYM